MGDRKCAFEGCNALEFRATGYCLRHKGGEWNLKNSNVSAFTENDSRQSIPETKWYWTIFLLIWVFPPIIAVIIPIVMVIIPLILISYSYSHFLKTKALSDNEDSVEKDHGQSGNSEQEMYETSGTESPDVTEDPWWVVD